MLVLENVPYIECPYDQCSYIKFRNTEHGTELVVVLPQYKEELGAWLEATKYINIPKESLVQILRKFYTEEEAEILAGTILTGRMLDR
jgi:hypothetical protein